MEEPQFFKLEGLAEQEFVLQLQSFSVKITVNGLEISLSKTCTIRPDFSLTGPINDSKGYKACRPEEFWDQYEAFSKTFYSYHTFERLLLDQLYKSKAPIVPHIIQPGNH